MTADSTDPTEAASLQPPRFLQRLRTLALRLLEGGTMKNDDLASSRNQLVLELVRSWAEEESRCESTVFDDSSGWFRLTLTAVRNGDRWQIAGLHLSPSRKRSIAIRLKSPG
jgi:hypothetical protein